jgi:hypothetical protein
MHIAVSTFLALTTALLVSSTGCTSSTAPSSDIEGAAEEQLQTNDLTEDQSKKVLALLDDACGDSWCEGDFDFLFAKFQCAFAGASACTLTMRLTPDEQPARTFWRSCRFVSFAGYTDIVRSAEDGHASLTSEFREAVTDCVDRVEGGIRAR